MRALCEKHNLAVAADGKCVVCRRPLGGALGFRPEPVESVLNKVVTVLLLLGLCAALGGLAYLSTLPEPYSGPKSMAGRAPDEDTSLATVRPTVLPAEPDGGAPTGAAVATTDGGAVAAITPTTPEAQAAANAAAPAKPEPPVDPRARYAARANVPVTLFTAEWCLLCNQARDYLLVRGVAVQSLDIDADKVAYERLLKLNKAATLPTFEVAGKPIIGFNPTDLEATIDAAAVAATMPAPKPAPKPKAATKPATKAQPTTAAASSP